MGCCLYLVKTVRHTTCFIDVCRSDLKYILKDGGNDHGNGEINIFYSAYKSKYNRNNTISGKS